jgi:hemerythrin-like domain-containing protein
MRDQRQAPRRKDTTSPRDAIALLKRDHTRLKSLLAALQAAQTTARRESLLAQTEALLKQHTEIEEQVFYPAFRDVAQSKRDRQLFHEAAEEHHVVDVVLPEVKQARHAPDVFAARAKVLKELVEHHIDEEHDELFPRARRLLAAETLRELGDRMTEQQRAAKRPSALQSVGQLIGLTS